MGGARPQPLHLLLQGGDTTTELHYVSDGDHERGCSRTTTRVSTADRKPLPQVCTLRQLSCHHGKWSLHNRTQGACFLPLQQPAPPPRSHPVLAQGGTWFLILPPPPTRCVTPDRSLTLSGQPLPALYNGDVGFRDSTNSSISDLLESVMGVT